MLTVRGMRLARGLARRGFPVVEGYPGGAQDILGLPRKKAGVELLQGSLRKEGLGGDLDRRPLTHDELDAVTIAWVGWNFRRGNGVLIGDPSEGLMLLPEPKRSTARRRLPARARSGATAKTVARRGDS
jgi:predicted nuclease with RNAse H fold